MSGLISYLPYLVNGGVALIVLCLMIVRLLVPGWLYQEKQEEIKELKQALEHERDRSDAAVAAASATRDILLSLRGRFSEEEASLVLAQKAGKESGRGRSPGA